MYVQVVGKLMVLFHPCFVLASTVQGLIFSVLMHIYLNNIFLFSRFYKMFLKTKIKSLFLPGEYSFYIYCNIINKSKKQVKEKKRIQSFLLKQVHLESFIFLTVFQQFALLKCLQKITELLDLLRISILKQRLLQWHVLKSWNTNKTFTEIRNIQQNSMWERNAS